ncbi:hypothetical protein SUDANB121_04421 [Nocardiopsis dassonvillei]
MGPVRPLPALLPGPGSATDRERGLSGAAGSDIGHAAGPGNPTPSRDGGDHPAAPRAGTLEA